MRARHAGGLAVVMLAAAIAAIVWAPATSAQQVVNGWQRGPVVVTRSAGAGAPQTVARLGQATELLALAGGPRLGVSIRDVETADVSKMRLAGPGGVVIEDVTKGSAAEKAGLKAGDVILQFDGETVRSTRQFTRLVGESAVGRAVKIGLIRDGKRTDVEATLTKAEGSAFDVAIDRDEIKRNVEESLKKVEPMIREFRQQQRLPNGILRQWQTPNGRSFNFDMPFFDTLTTRGRLGVTVQELTPELATYFGVKDGVLVATVRADSPAAKAGIKAGDVITAVNDKSIGDADALVTQLRDKEGEVSISLSRDKRAMTVKATMGKTSAAPKTKVVVRGAGQV